MAEVKKLTTIMRKRNQKHQWKNCKILGKDDEDAKEEEKVVAVGHP